MANDDVPQISTEAVFLIQARTSLRKNPNFRSLKGVMAPAVRFSESIDTLVVDYSSLVPSLVWYDETEISSFKSDKKRQADKLENGFKEDTSMGLERWTKQGMEKFERNRAAAREVVLGQKHNRIEDRISENEEHIANSYRDAALHANIVANSKGMRAERAAMEFLSSSSTTPEVRRSSFHLPIRERSTSSMPEVRRSSINLPIQGRNMRSSFSGFEIPKNKYYRSSKYVSARDEIRHALSNVRRLGLLGNTHASE
eukprot:scaffold10339_cov101-Cylindrotheca_fusiformis.AAC.5